MQRNTANIGGRIRLVSLWQITSNKKNYSHLPMDMKGQFWVEALEGTENSSKNMQCLIMNGTSANFPIEHLACHLKKIVHMQSMGETYRSSIVVPL